MKTIKEYKEVPRGAYYVRVARYQESDNVYYVRYGVADSPYDFGAGLELFYKVANARQAYGYEIELYKAESEYDKIIARVINFMSDSTPIVHFCN